MQECQPMGVKYTVHTVIIILRVVYLITRKQHSLSSYCDEYFKIVFIFLIQALLTLFVFSTKDGWVTIMYDGIDAVGIDKQVSADWVQFVIRSCPCSAL